MARQRLYPRIALTQGRLMNIEELNTSPGALEAGSVRLLLVRARNGEEAAFKALFDVYKGRVYSTCLSVTRGRRAAEELTTQVFLTLFRNLNTYKSEGDFVRRMDFLASFVSVLHVKRKTNEMAHEAEVAL